MNKTLGVIFIGLISAAAYAGDYQSCVGIKVAAKRLACFDQAAAAEAKVVAEQAQAGKAAEEQQALTLQAVNQLKAKLVENFKDPSSVQFRNVVAYGPAPGAITFLCGSLNGKNSYGAYTGFKRFFMIGEIATIENKDNGDLINSMWSKTCSGDEIYRQKDESLKAG